jgi:3-hydroxyacyl-CoA dehydrogenase
MPDTPQPAPAPPAVTELTVRGRVAVIRVDHPPVNGLSHAVRAGIVGRLREALADPAVDAVVLTGRPGFFSAGADIAEFGSPAATAAPTLTAVIEDVESAAKPVVAAIDGACLGGGLELALACHYRVATPASRLGLPEVNLGLVPGAGGTQRLPRALGIRTAAEMITSGRPRTAAALATLPHQRLIDELVTADADGDVVTTAIRFAASVPTSSSTPSSSFSVSSSAGGFPVLRELGVERAGDGELGELREGLRRGGRGMVAPLVALELVEKAAEVAFDEGVAAERAAFTELVAGEQSAALRYAFFAERAARKVPGLAAGTAAREVRRVAVIGAGTMGGGIAMSFADAGLPVTIVDSGREALDRGMDVIRRNYQRQVDRGRLGAAALAERLGLITPSLELADVAGADLVVEAVFEDLDVKRALFAELDRVARPGTVLATNTSTLDVDAIAAATGRPGDVVGLHFFSPANVMKLLEVVRADRTADDVLATATAVGQRLGKTTVVARVCDGFIGNRMLAAYRDAAMVLLRNGSTPSDVDGAVEGFGFAMGPFRAGDLAGNDIGWAVRKRRYAEHPELARDELSDALCERGRFGQKTGGGWYDYRAGSREALPSAAVDELLATYWREHGVTRAAVAPEEIVERLLFALADAGARIVAEGVALRGSDIDVVWLAGYGFPRHRGGPMYHADRVGPPAVLAALRRFHGDDGWRPAPLLARLAADGGAFVRAG